MTERTWLEAEFHSHTFHYRTPDTASILAINPGIPSPLTLKMALVAVLLQQGRREEAEKLAGQLHELDVRIQPPPASVTFRGFMRYVRPPKSGNQVDKGTGSAYRISPHQREYTLWAGTLLVYLGVPPAVVGLVEEAVPAIPYLGAKDSLVTCLGVRRVTEPPERVATPVDPQGELPEAGVIVQLADLVADPAGLLSLLPGQRRARDYAVRPYYLPGQTRSDGRSRVYSRRTAGGLQRLF